MNFDEPFVVAQTNIKKDEWGWIQMGVNRQWRVDMLSKIIIILTVCLLAAVLVYITSSLLIRIFAGLFAAIIIGLLSKAKLVRRQRKY